MSTAIITSQPRSDEVSVVSKWRNQYGICDTSITDTDTWTV